MNNRKQTSLNAREYRQRPLKIVIGFSVSAAKTDSNGKKLNNPFRVFVPVNQPENKVDSRLPSKRRQKIKRDNWMVSIREARKAADEVAKNQGFTCHVFPQVLSTAVSIRRA